MPNTKGMDGGPIASIAKLPAPLFAPTKRASMPRNMQIPQICGAG